MTISRRGFIKGAAGAAVAAGITTAASGAAEAAATLPDPKDSGIDHIVVLMMENRSFDHYLGWLPGADGKQSGLTYYDRNNVAHTTHHLDTWQGCGMADPDHSFEGGRVEYNDGKCDGWLRAGSNDEFSIGYYQAADLAFYGKAARYWTTCDRYFSAIMAETYPNRFYQHAAQTDRIHNSSAISTLPTIWDRIAGAGLKGKYYYYDTPFTALWGTRHLGISAPYADFLNDAAVGNLPELSFIDPKFLDEGSGTSADDHPHADIRAGQTFINQVYNAVTSSPAWERTLFVINYDEWGGFFDHVAPSVAPDANPAWGLRGFRTPCLVISPRARRNYVAHNTYDHTSVLKAVEWRWGLEPLTPRDAAARNIAEVLDFTSAPNLTAPKWDVPAVVGMPCPPEQLTALAGDYEEWRGLQKLAKEQGFAV